MTASETAERLRKCFAAVFPDATGDEISAAKQVTLAGWDSMASLTLFALIEEEFQVQLEASTLERFTSFEEILRALEEIQKKN
jgi:acyl carrier protein